MERKKTTSEDAIQKTIHLLETINLKIENKEFPFSVYKLAQSQAIGNNTVRAIFKLGILTNVGNSYSGKYEWVQPVGTKRETAVRVMNKALEFRNTDNYRQAALQGLAGGNKDASNADIDALKQKFFKSPKNALKSQTLFSSSDDKLNHAVKIAAGISSGVYKAAFQHIINPADGANFADANNMIIEATQDLLNKLYNIKF